jgi:plasmid stabilization system protein ParE
MGNYRLSTKADLDMGDIAYYTLATFGIGQARTYRD